MTNEIEQAITETLQIIENYIDVAIVNNHEKTTENFDILSLRLLNGLSVARVAIELEQTAEYVTQIENGLRRCTVADAMKLASLYGVSADSLI